MLLMGELHIVITSTKLPCIARLKGALQDRIMEATNAALLEVSPDAYYGTVMPA